MVVMCVAGCGKSSLGAALARAEGALLIEGDEHHSPANLQKMEQGIPLSDADRQGWLDSLADELRARPSGAVLTCSALKRAYRAIIIGDRPDVALVYLRGSYDLIHDRMAARHEHFMPVALLDSQFQALEEPTPDERPITVDIGGRPAEIAAAVVAALRERAQ